MAENKIDAGEIFGVVGGAATGIAGALSNPSTTTTTTATSSMPPINVGSALVGAGVGAGLAYVAGGPVGIGAVVGGLLGAFVNPIAVMPGGV